MRDEVELTPLTTFDHERRRREGERRRDVVQNNLQFLCRHGSLLRYRDGAFLVVGLRKILVVKELAAPLRPDLLTIRHTDKRADIVNSGFGAYFRGDGRDNRSSSCQQPQG